MGKKKSIGFNPENQWLSAMLSLTTNGHQSSTTSSTTRTSSFPAESYSQMAVSGIHKDSERRVMVNRSGAWMLVLKREEMTCLSRRCLRGSRTALTVAVALSPMHALRRHPAAVAAGTAWREMGRPWRWEGYY